MEQDEVIAVFGALEATEMRLWVAGGWGVDALVGRQTRAHRDLDLLIDVERLEECLTLLAARGYAVGTGRLPTAAECRPAWTEPGSTIRRAPVPALRLR